MRDRRRQLRRPFQRGFAGQDFPALLIAQVLGAIVALVQEHLPIRRNGPEVGHLNIAVVDCDVGAWPFVRDACAALPYAFRADAGRLGLNLRDQVAAELAARRFREHFCAAQGELARCDQVALLLHDPRLALRGQCGDVEIGIGTDECLQGRLVPGVLVLAKGGVPAPGQPAEVSVGQGQLRHGVTLVETEQRLVKPDGLEHGRVGVGTRSGLPCHELLRRVEDRAVGG